MTSVSALFSSIISAKCGNYRKIDHDRLLPHFSQFVIHSCPPVDVNISYLAEIA